MKLIGNRVFLIPNRLPLVNQDKYFLVLAGDHYKLNFGTLTSAKSPNNSTISSVPYFNKFSFTIANTLFVKKSSAPQALFLLSGTKARW